MSPRIGNDSAKVADRNVVELRNELEKIFDLKGAGVEVVKAPSPVKVEIPEINLDVYKEDAKEAVKDIQSRVGKEGQFLNWITKLPETQLANIDSIYNLAEEAKEGGFTDIAVLGIGGSRHTTEAMMKMLGKDTNVHFYSAVDPESCKKS